MESLDILRYARVPNSTLKKKLWPLVSNVHLPKREEEQRSHSDLLLTSHRENMGEFRISLLFRVHVLPDYLHQCFLSINIAERGSYSASN